jgi:hypothetical protein
MCKVGECEKNGGNVNRATLADRERGGKQQVVVSKDFIWEVANELG